MPLETFVDRLKIKTTLEARNKMVKNSAIYQTIKWSVASVNIIN